jgi:Ca2+-transporting ATPase
MSEVLEGLKTSEDGLSSKEASLRLTKFGANIIEKQKRTPYFVKFLLQFTDLMAIVLLVAVVLSLLLGSSRDALIIFLVVVANSTIGFFQEYKADKTIEALRKLVSQSTTVIRDNGDRIVVDTSEIVPGDIIVLSEGMKIPADIRLISANELETNDASLTGESEPQLKKALETESSDTSLVEIRGSVFMGTDVVSGDGIGVVIATGMDTHFGEIAQVTTSQKVTKSPLQIEVDRIAKTVAKATFIVIPILLVIYCITIGRLDLLESFKFAIGVASSLVPEGLPATVSIALAVGIQKMARRKAVIRRLSAVETLGEANYIITDKTGTLTKNQMTAKEMFFDGKEYQIGGVGHNLNGTIIRDNIKCDKSELESAGLLFSSATVANNAEIDLHNKKNPDFSGDSTELALLIAAEKAGFNTYDAQKKAKLLQEIPFTSERKFMAKAVEIEGKEFVFVKGASSVVLGKCTKIYHNDSPKHLAAGDVQKINEIVDKYSREALRVIAVAYKPIDDKPIDSGLIFLGLFGIIDPPREDVAEAIALAKKSGISIMMATGDYGLTAAAIGKKIGLNTDPTIIEGGKLDKIDDKELYEIIKSGDVVFSRVDPTHKLRLVKVLHAHKNIVSVTGDGVNDAPALKTSEIGVAMGITGTDVTKEAAEMVLLDDSFSSIVGAIKEGRIVYDNIKKVTKFVFTSNIAEFVAVVFGLFLGLTPISVIQILLVDLCAEVFPALALAGDKEEDDVMAKSPRSRSDVLFGRETVLYILRSGLLMGIFATAAFCIFCYLNGWRFGEKISNGNMYIVATTVTYATMALCQYVNSFSVRSFSKPIWTLFDSKRVWISIGISFTCICSLMYVPILAEFSTMSGLPLAGWAIAIVAAFIYLVSIEIIKRYISKAKVRIQ